MMNFLQGTGVALVTPFDDTFQPDWKSLENLVHFCIDGGVNYLVVLGTTAESATLTHDEKNQAIQVIAAANNNRVPMVLGIGGNNTTSVVQEIKGQNFDGFSAILSVSPYYNKPTQEGIFAHYAEISKHSPLPIILYNVPGRTASNINSDTTVRLAQDFQNIIAVKEASPNFLQSTEIINKKPKSFLVISGDDELTTPMTLAGGSGVISVIAQGIPKPFSQMVNLAIERKVDEAYALHYTLMNLTRLIYVEGNPAGIKALLHLQGVIHSPNTRLPLLPASVDLTNAIRKELESLDVV